jgi:hypothetical protein
MENLTLEKGHKVKIKKDGLNEYFKSMAEKIKGMSFREELNNIQKNDILGEIQKTLPKIEMAVVIFNKQEYTLPFNVLVRIETNLYKLWGAVLDSMTRIMDIAQKSQISALKNNIHIHEAWTSKKVLDESL